MTVEPPRFIEFCRSITDAQAERSNWHNFCGIEFRKCQTRTTGGRGRLVYIPTGGGPDLPPSVYGDAVIPQRYITAKWSDRFHLVDYLDDPARFWQAVAVLTRRE